MVAILQQVNHASLNVGKNLICSINKGVIIFVGIHRDDNANDVISLGNKILKTRIFKDSFNKINLNLLSANYEVMLVSNFTLIADLNSGNRPNFSHSATKENALKLFEDLKNHLVNNDVKKVCQGVFGEHMHIVCEQDGPINLILHS